MVKTKYSSCWLQLREIPSMQWASGIIPSVFCIQQCSTEKKRTPSVCECVCTCTRVCIRVHMSSICTSRGKERRVRERWREAGGGDLLWEFPHIFLKAEKSFSMLSLSWRTGAPGLELSPSLRTSKDRRKKDAAVSPRVQKPVNWEHGCMNGGSRCEKEPGFTSLSSFVLPLLSVDGRSSHWWGRSCST